MCVKQRSTPIHSKHDWKWKERRGGVSLHSDPLTHTHKTPTLFINPDNINIT